MSNWTVTPDGLVVFERSRTETEAAGDKWTHEDKIVDLLFSRRFVPVELLRSIAWRETSRRHDMTRRAGRPLFESRSRKREDGTSLLDWRMIDADALIFEQIRRQLVAAIRAGETAIDFTIALPYRLADPTEDSGIPTMRYRFSALLESDEARDPDNVDETVKRLFTLYTNGGEYR